MERVLLYSLKSNKLVVGTTKAFLLGKNISFSDHMHSQYANKTHTHSASQIASGVLPVARGGTGVTNINDLKKSLGISDSINVKQIILDDKTQTGSSNKYFSSGSFNTMEFFSSTIPLFGIDNSYEYICFIEVMIYYYSLTFNLTSIGSYSTGYISIRISGTVYNGSSATSLGGSGRTVGTINKTSSASQFNLIHPITDSGLSDYRGVVDSIIITPPAQVGRYEFPEISTTVGYDMSVENGAKGTARLNSSSYRRRIIYGLYY